MGKGAVAFLLAAGLVLLLLAGCTPPAPPPGPDHPPVTDRVYGKDGGSSDGGGTSSNGSGEGGGSVLEGDPRAGSSIYASNCALCHGQNGEGGAAPALVGVKDRLGEEEHLAVVRDGRPGKGMPSWKERLTEKEIRDVVVYERTLE